MYFPYASYAYFPSVYIEPGFIISNQACEKGNHLV